MLIILFGLAGSGKNYIGKLIEKSIPNYYFWDADQVLPIEMQECIHQKKIFTQEMRDNFTKIMISEVKLLQRKHPDLVISQALYKEENRNQILKAFPDAVFIHIQAQPNMILQRLRARGDEINESYAEKMAIHFEQPSLPHSILINDKDKNILDQFELIIKS